MLASGRTERTGLRIVIAHDLSPEADRAVTAIAAAEWPPSTEARIVTSSTGIGPGPSSFALVREARAHARAVRVSVESAHSRVASTLAGAGISVETSIVTGRPGRAIVRDANRFGADLIVSGARSQSPLVSTFLGSVSSEIAERARCSVLIARVESIGRVILAADDSRATRTAVEIAASWPVFGTTAIRVISVASRPSNYTASVLRADEVEDAMAESLATARDHARGPIDAALRRLAAAGREVDGRVRVGDPAEEIMAAAREWPADLIVLGASGTSLVRRLILGSVARTVLEGSSSSVLIARRPVGPRAT